MAGDYSESVRPTLPGAYTRYIAQRPATAPPAPGSVVAVPVPHDWGPMDEARLITSYAQWQEEFGVAGIASDTPGDRAIRDVFRGEGLPGLGGAGGALVTRFGGSSAAKATVTLDNPADGDAVTLTTKYETGKTGFKVVANPIVSNVQTIDFYDDATLLESYSFTTNATGALAGLVAQINATSKVFDAELELEGVTGLKAGTFALTGGNSGMTLAAGDWTDVWSTFANDDFAYIAPYDVPWAPGVGEPQATNRAIIDGLVQWVKDENARGHRVSAVVGGALDETVADAVSRATGINSEFIITIGGPGVNHEDWGAMSTAQLVPRIAGILANRGETQSAHFARIAGTLPRPKVTGGAISLTDAETLTNAGVIAIMRDRYQEAPTRLVKSVTTYSGDTDDKPRQIYGNPKFVLSMQQFANEVEADAERHLIGRVVISDKVRDAIAARALRIARRREPLAFSEGTQVIALPGEETDEHVQLQITLLFGRALAQLFIQANVR